MGASAGGLEAFERFFQNMSNDSGMGTDGTLGLRSVKGELGMAMVQTPDSAKYNAMPRSAIETDLVDYILPPEKMPAQLIAYANHAAKNVEPKLKAVEGKVPDAMHKIFILLRTHTGHDFSSYKKNTIYRRIERRMQLHQMDKIATYVRLLQENKDEVEALFRELLIGVTNFFRDPEPFKALIENALPRLLADKPDDYTIRAWVPGCSSGEEAYSIAILLRECTEKLKRHVGIQIFATNIDKSTIDTARAGLYPASISADVSAKPLENERQERIRKNPRTRPQHAARPHAKTGNPQAISRQNLFQN